MAWIGGLIGGALSLFGASESADAAQNAANTQSASTDAAIAERRRQYDLTRGDTKPFIDTGVAANARLRQLLGIDGGTSDLTRRFTAADLSADPVYGAGLDVGLREGARGINARAIGSGVYDSGATLKALTRFGNDYATGKANEAYNRFNADNTNMYNRLAGISGTGQTALGQVTSAGNSASGDIANLLTQQGNANAAGIVGGANAWGAGAQNVNNAWNNYQNNQILQGLINPRGGAGGSGGGWYPNADPYGNGGDILYG